MAFVSRLGMVAIEFATTPLSEPEVEKYSNSRAP